MLRDAHFQFSPDYRASGGRGWPGSLLISPARSLIGEFEAIALVCAIGWLASLWFTSLWFISHVADCGAALEALDQLR
jgi:hypothetical protein